MEKVLLYLNKLQKNTRDEYTMFLVLNHGRRRILISTRITILSYEY